MSGDSTPSQGRRSRYALPHLRAWRTVSQLSAMHFAQRAGVAQNVVLFAENGQRKPYLETVEKLADALGIPPHVLLTYSPCDEEAREYTMALAYRATLERLAQLDPEHCSQATKGA